MEAFLGLCSILNLGLFKKVKATWSIAELTFWEKVAGAIVVKVIAALIATSSRHVPFSTLFLSSAFLSLGLHSRL